MTGYLIYPLKAFLKVSTISNIRKLVKTPPILQVSPWSLGGRGVFDWGRDGIEILKISLGSFSVSFI